MDASQEKMFRAVSRLGEFGLADIASYADVDPTVARAFLQENACWFDLIAEDGGGNEEPAARWRVKASEREALFDLVASFPDARSDPQAKRNHSTAEKLEAILNEAAKPDEPADTCQCLLQRARAHIDMLQTELWDAQVTGIREYRDKQKICSKLRERFDKLWQHAGKTDQATGDEHAKQLHDALFDWSLSPPKVPSPAALPGRAGPSDAPKGEALMKALLLETNHVRPGDSYGIFRPALTALSYQETVDAIAWRELHNAALRLIPRSLSMPQAGSRLAATAILAVVLQAKEVARPLFRILLDSDAQEFVPLDDRRCALSAFARLAAIPSERSNSNYAAATCRYLIETECFDSEFLTLLPGALCHKSPAGEALLDRASDMFDLNGLKPPHRESVDESRFLRSIAVALFLNDSDDDTKDDLMTLLAPRHEFFLSAMCRPPTEAINMTEGSDMIVLRPGRAIRSVLQGRNREFRFNSIECVQAGRNVLQYQADGSWVEAFADDTFYAGLGIKSSKNLGWEEA